MVPSPPVMPDSTERLQSSVRNYYKRDIPKSLLPQLVTLERKDNWHNIFTIGIDWLTIAACVGGTLLLHMNPIAYVVAIIIIGSRQRALMNLLHEASHNKLFRNRAMNNWIGRGFTAYPLGASFTAYQSNHYIHHGFLWDIEKDPKTMRYEQLGLIHPPSDRLAFFWKHIMQPMLLVHAFYNIKAALSLKDERRSESPVRYGFLAALMVIMVLTHILWGFFLFWLVPFCTTFQVIRYWNEMAEHAGLDDLNTWMGTRNWNSNAFTRWLIGPHSDDNYHLVHHLFPLIPHYNLAKAHQLLLSVPPYAAAHHCDGFFFQRRKNAPSVLQDIRRPGDIGKYYQHHSPAEDLSLAQPS